MTEASLASVPDLKGTDLPDVWRPSTAAEAPARKATDVLYEHDELMRRMIEDMLAAAVTLPLGSPEFRDQLLALQAGILHHAGSEKGSMFKEAGRLSDARLYELGARLETMLDEERTSRAKQAFRSLKIGRMEEI